MIKRIIALFLCVVLTLCIAGCDISKKIENKLPDYSQRDIKILALWAPYELTEENLKVYKDAGFNTLPFSGRGSGDASSENRYYLGSNRTKKALDLCKKMGLDAWISYSYWSAKSIEGEDYYSQNNPFSQHNLYDEYKDIITGVRIWDEPSKKDQEMLANPKLIDDFKKVYPNAHYIVNLTPKYASASYYGFDTYDELVGYYTDNIMNKFDNKIISVDYYPFSNEEHPTYPRRNDWLISLEVIAKVAKEYNAQMAVIMQSSTGLEFAKELAEADMRLQANIALCFGADILEYYLYAVPLEDEVRYNHCILNRDNTPSQLYYHVQKVNKEVQSYSNVILSYDWDSAIAVNPVGFSGNKDVSVMMRNELKDAKHYEKAISSTDLVISRFTSEKYGEAYMLVNYAQKGIDNNIATVTFKDCSKIAVYGGNGFDGTPQIVELDEENKYRVELEYGEGVFVVPMA